VSELWVSERLRGSSTTDFGAPGMAPAVDAKTLDQAGLGRSERVLEACWESFDAAVRAAKGKSLSTGPRGGGRNLEKLIEQVIGADGAYMSGLGWKVRRPARAKESQRLEQVRAAILGGFREAAAGGIPAVGPRGGRHWSARYFVRRVAWHVLDHAWEIEDRLG
jgi:hypothetical protein